MLVDDMATLVTTNSDITPVHGLPFDEVQFEMTLAPIPMQPPDTNASDPEIVTPATPLTIDSTIVPSAVAPIRVSVARETAVPDTGSNAVPLIVFT
jgi:hypothetical protein